jgi:hypothetical protein
MQKQKKVSPKDRQEIEELIYKVYDTIDKTHTNSDYYKNIFSKMSDEEFYKFFERRLPLRFHEDAFKIQPKMYEIVDAFKILDKPLLERVNFPHIYVNSNGKPVQSKECMVIYIHIKRMKQMLSKKNNASMRVGKRDMRTGLLMQEDKAAKETDREFESLASYGLDYTMDEFRTVKADAMQASAEMIATIVDKGSVSQNDYAVTKVDGLARNMLNVYLLGAGVYSNLIDREYMTPLTAKNKQKRIERV